MKAFDTLLNKYDYKHRLQLLRWSIVPIFLLCYFFAFKKTFTTIKEYSKNTALAIQGSTLNDSLKIYEAKQTNLSLWKKQYIIESGMNDGNILADINIECRNLGLKFIEYKPLGINSENIWTRSFTVEGDFLPILRLMYSLEQLKKLCRVASVSYKKVKVKDVDALQCTFFIQNIIQQ